MCISLDEPAGPRTASSYFYFCFCFYLLFLFLVFRSRTQLVPSLQFLSGSERTPGGELSPVE